MDNDAPHEDGEVTLMTLHAAKGADTVFLPGWEEGIFPLSALS